MKKRDLYSEIAEGFEALAKVRKGKRTLHTNKVELKPAPEVTAEDLLVVRERLKLSGQVVAHYLRTNPWMVENWEQGCAKPNA